MKLKKGTISTRCWDKEIGSDTWVPHQGLVSTHFGIHKNMYNDGRFDWTITHLGTGMSVGLLFDPLKQARHAVALLESTPAPCPWSELTLDSLQRCSENAELIQDIRAKSYKI